MLEYPANETLSFFQKNQSDIEGLIGSGIATVVCGAFAIAEQCPIFIAGSVFFAGVSAAYASGLFQSRKRGAAPV